MKRAYLHGILDLNAGKLNALNALFAPFRDALKKTMAYWHVRLQQGADLPLYVALPDKTSVGGLSARQMAWATWYAPSSYHGRRCWNCAYAISSRIRP